MSSPFPPEILCEISLHLPHTEDVIALSLTSHTVRAALSTPALFKARLLLQNWDLEAWQDEDDKAQSSGDWKRWTRIDYIHSKTLQLLEEASASGLSPPPPSPHPELRNTCIHFGKSVDWSRRLSKVFPMLITHHRGNDIPHITETKYCNALRAYLVVVTELYMSLFTPTPGQPTCEIPSSFSTFSWLERACFGLVAFLMQCTANSIESVFGDPRATARCKWTSYVTDPFAKLELVSRALLSCIGDASAHRDIIGTSMCYAAGFLIQVKMSLELHFSVMDGLKLSLLPPSLPPMDPASLYDEPDEVGSATFLWPWLRHGLAGTPIVGLSSSSGCGWAGYYTAGVNEMHDPPMFFKLYLVPPPSTDAAANKVYFRGEGADGVGSFTLQGETDTETGVVNAVKTYVGAHLWNWHGMITPFGMVGVWGMGRAPYGWWWIWPQEWSERSSAPATTVTK